MGSRFGPCMRQVTSFAKRLRGDARGSSLLMLAAGLVPMMAAIGGGVDLTRAYMAQARLQQAVDAAALAGRKAMDGTDVSTAQGAVQKFIAFNFPAGLYQAQPLQTTLATTPEGALIVTSSTRVPTTLMAAFGLEDIAISAEASARRSGTNIDVVLVLDVTGSMAYDVSGGNGNPKKIDALKTAALSFLDQLDSTRTQLAVSGLRVRVGIVPYSQTVNIGRHLRAENVNYIALTGHAAVTQLYWQATKNSGTSNLWYNKNATTGTATYYGWGCYGLPNTGTTCKTGLDLTNFVTAGGVAGTTYTNAYAWKGCVEMRPTVTTIASTSDKTVIPASAWDITDVAPGVSVNGATAPAWRPYFALPQWDNGGNISSTNRYAPPSGATPANYTTATTEPWRSMIFPVKNNSAGSAQFESAAPNPTASSTGGEWGPNNNCPAETKLLSNESLQTKAQLTSYINALKPVGSTLHDVGMFWGLAMISPGAPFVNPDRVNNREVKRYIIFMTDGAMDPNEPTYSAYGVDDHEPRTKTGTGDTTAQHNKRFDMLCERAKRGFGPESAGVNISTIAFGTAVTPQLRACASTEEQAYLASNAADLNNIFKQIAQNIGYLRLAQ